MAVNLKAPTALHPIAGLRLGCAEAAIKKPGRKDVLVVEIAPGAEVAGVFTRNAFAAAPVQVCRERLTSASGIRALLINSGNANAATGAAGVADAQAACAVVAREVGCRPEQVLPFSTGVIGQRLPMERMLSAISKATSHLRADAWLDAMRAIMTTDTVPKGATRQVRTAAGPVTVTGIAKGVGMIHPDMATLLAFIATDAKLSGVATRALLGQAVNRSFNCVTVDGDTSTNDACMLIATGQVGENPLAQDGTDYAVVARAVEEVCRDLAHAVVRDGEGATKFIAVHVAEAKDVAEARAVALSIANSPLVKTAMFAGDANWGRIAMAIGKAGIPELDAGRVSISLDDVPVLKEGAPHADYRDELGTAVVARPEFAIRVGLGRGRSETTVWTCDFSYDYVKINAEYRT